MKHFFPIYLTSAVVGTALVYYGAPLFKRVPQTVSSLESVGEKENVQPENAPAESPRVLTAEADIPPPAMSGIYIAKRNEPSSWGITITETSVYTPDGNRKGVVKGGQIFRFKKLVSSSNGSMALCVFVDLPTSREYLIKKQNSLLFTGEFNKLHKSQLDALKSYYLLRGQIAERRRILFEKEGRKNPYFESYQKLYKDYVFLTEKAKRLNAANKSKTGLQREAITEELRKMHVEEAALKKKYDEVRAKYNAWKSEHAVNLNKNTDADPEIVRLKKKQAVEKERIRGLAI